MQREIFYSRDSTLNWCRDKKLLPQVDSVKCTLCDSQAIFEDSNGYVAGRFRCRKRIGQHSVNRSKKKITVRFDFEQSGTKNTFFFNSKIGIEKSLVLTYCWANNFDYRQTREICHSISQNEDSRLSQETICDWFSYLREVSLSALDTLYNQTGQIGGPGRIVEIDETKFGKRKYNRGKRVEGSWILGMIEIDTEASHALKGNFRLEICPDNRRDAETLLPLIQKHIAPGTTIHSDCWKAYGSLEELGYKHYTVNHSEHYKDPETGVHTNNIESNWRPLKRALQGSSKNTLADHLCEYLWRREIRKKDGDFMTNLIDDIARVDWTEFTEAIEETNQPTSSKRTKDSDEDEPQQNKRKQ